LQLLTDNYVKIYCKLLYVSTYQLILFKEKVVKLPNCIFDFSLTLDPTQPNMSHSNRKKTWHVLSKSYQWNL